MNNTKELSFQEAFDNLNKVSSADIAEEEMIASRLTIEKFATVIDIARKKYDSLAEKYVKETGNTISGTIAAKLPDDKGNIVPQTIKYGAEIVSTSKNVIDSETLKSDLGVSLEQNSDNPDIFTINLNGHGSLFKAPTMTINPDKVTAAVTSGQLDPKYVKTKVTSKPTASITIIKNEI